MTHCSVLCTVQTRLITCPPFRVASPYSIPILQYSTFCGMSANCLCWNFYGKIRSVRADKIRKGRDLTTRMWEDERYTWAVGMHGQEISLSQSYLRVHVHTYAHACYTVVARQTNGRTDHRAKCHGSIPPTLSVNFLYFWEKRKKDGHKGEIKRSHAYRGKLLLECLFLTRKN